MGLGVECIKMGDHLLLSENLLFKLLLEDERSDWVNPIVDEREKCGEFHTLFPMLLEQALNLEWGPTRSVTSYIILGHIFSSKIKKWKQGLARNYTTYWHTRPEKTKWFGFDRQSAKHVRRRQGSTAPLRPPPLKHVCFAVVGRVCQCKISARYGCSVTTALQEKPEKWK